MTLPNIFALGPGPAVNMRYDPSAALRALEAHADCDDFFHPERAAARADSPMFGFSGDRARDVAERLDILRSALAVCEDEERQRGELRWASGGSAGSFGATVDCLKQNIALLETEAS